MGVRITRWGNSPGLRICRQVVECAGLRVGDKVYVRVLD